MNTLEQLKDALDNAVQTYGHCLVEDCQKSGLSDLLEEWARLSCELSDELDAIL